MKQYILMSDVINSGSKDAQRLSNNLSKCTAYINEKYRDEIFSPLTITLGDEFQSVIGDLETSIKIIIDIEEYVVKNNYDMKLRYVLFFGEIETAINRDIAYGMLGLGLTTARNLINNMKSSEYRFKIEIGNQDLNILLNNGFNIYQNIVDKWKIDRDYVLITNLIKYHDYKIVSEIMQKEQSLIWKREKSLNISSYNSSKEILLTIPQLSL